jgi:hypothetical protein
MERPKVEMTTKEQIIHALEIGLTVRNTLLQDIKIPNLKERKDHHWRPATINKESNWNSHWRREVYVVDAIDSDQLIVFTGNYGNELITKEFAEANITISKELSEEDSEDLWEDLLAILLTKREVI